MEPKFVLPSPNFNKNSKESSKSNLHYLTPCGMTLLPRSKQPPPMYGARGSTVPAKYLNPNQLQLNNKDASTAISDTPPIYNSPPRTEYCENCGFELATGQDMRRHLEQHETCPAENCNFTALPSILERHMEAFHITGLYKTVKKVWTPEDIAAWRAERRKKFPTTVNVERAKKAKEQRLKRGERLEASKARFGKPEDRRRTRPQNNRKEQPKQHKKQRNNANRNVKKQPQNEQNKTEIKEQLTPKIEEPIDLRMFRGTSQMKDYKHVKVKAKNEMNALSNLLGMYGTDTEEDEDEDEEEKVTDNETKATPEEPTDNEVTLLKTKIILDAIKENGEAVADDPTSVENTKEMEKELKAEGVILNTIDVPMEEDFNLAQSPRAEAMGSSDEAPDELPIERKTEAANEVVISAATSVEQPRLEAKTHVKCPAPKKKRFSGLNYKRARQMTKQNTMLSKLLETDVRHERNVLLQCVRYVCEQQFFGIGSISSSKI